MAGGKVVRWNSGAAVETTSFKDVKKFVKKGITPTTNRGLAQGVSESGWTAEEIQKGLKKEYKVNVVYVTRFLYSKKATSSLRTRPRATSPTGA